MEDEEDEVNSILFFFVPAENMLAHVRGAKPLLRTLRRVVIIRMF